MNAEVSVVIPVYDRDIRMLNDAIESVKNQTVQVKEIVVVDDGSRVPVSTKITRYKRDIKLVRKKNAGTGAARNTGIGVCTGNYYAFLDSDDIWSLDKIEKQLDALQTNSELEAVYGKAEQFYDTDTDDTFQKAHPILDPIINAQLSTALLIKKDAFFRVGAFSENHGSGVDIEWELRARNCGLRSLILPDIVYHRRIHHGNGGIVDREAGNKLRLAVIKEQIDRRRRQAKEDKRGI